MVAKEVLIVRTLVCIVDVSGMKGMLGEYNEYGIVTENEEVLYRGLSMMLSNSDLIKRHLNAGSGKKQYF